MSAATILRIASVLALLQGTAHATLFVRARPSHGPEEVALVEAMRTFHFDVQGLSRSYWDFYFGYGLMAAFVVFAEAALFWLLANGAATARPLVRSIAVLFIAYNLGHALLAARYFFITPIVPDLLISACLVAAVVRLRN